MSMFTGKRYDADGEPTAYGNGRSGMTIIAQGVRVEGDFTSQGDVQIEGEVQGHVATTGMLTVGPQARLVADVSADKAEVAGSIEGNLSVGSHLELKSTAKIIGDVICETAAIETGATLNGKVLIGRSANAAKGNAKQRPGTASADEGTTEQE